MGRKSNRIGRAGEDLARIRIGIREGMAARVTRTGRGHDFKAERYNPFTGATETTYYEVKTGPNARQTPLQKQMQEELGDDYEVMRVNLPFNPDLY